MLKNALMEQMEYRYSTEAIITIWLGKYQITQQDEFPIISQQGFFTEEEPCNIYFICQQPLITLVPNSLYYDETFIELQCIEHNKEEKTQKAIRIENPYADAQYKLQSDFPHKYFRIIDENGTTIAEGKVSHLLEGYAAEERDRGRTLEVLYIGQSNAADSYGAIQRLSSHKTLQKILFNLHLQSPDKEIYCLISNFQSDATLGILGQVNCNSGANVEIERFTKLNHTIQTIEKQKLLDLTEAVLIHYFKPHYNSHFTKTFLQKKQKTTQHFLDEDFNGVSITIDASDGGLVLYSEAAPAQPIHYKSFSFLKENNRISLFDYLNRHA
jgi:hypothetical protein